MKLRPYQSAALAAIDGAFEEHQSALLEMATGLGKTVTFAHAILRLPKHKRAMVLAHRKELIDQAARTIEQITGEEVGIERAEQYADKRTLYSVPPRIVVGTMQTQLADRHGRKRFQTFDPNEFGLLIIDEAHRSASNGYRIILRHYAQNQDLRILGVTATPQRLDKIALGGMYKAKPFSYGIKAGIDDGWLVPLRYEVKTVKSLDFSAVRNVAGELVEADLAKAEEEEKPLQEIVNGVMTVALGEGNLGRARAGVIFVPGVSVARAMAECANRPRWGIVDKAAAVWGGMPDEDRANVLRAFRERRLQAIFNVGVLTEGFDAPRIGLVAIARPTKSVGLYMQMLGRGTRPLPGLVDEHIDCPDSRHAAIAFSRKPYLLVQDYVGVGLKHRIVSAIDIFKGEAPPEIVELAIKQAEEGEALDPAEFIEKAEKEQIRRKKQKQEEDDAALERAKRRRKMVAKVEYDTREINPFDPYGLRMPMRKPQFEDPPPSEWQKRELARNGIDAEPLTFTLASGLIDQIRDRATAGLASPKQCKWLRGRGIDATGWTKQEASLKMGELLSKYKQRALQKASA